MKTAQAVAMLLFTTGLWGASSAIVAGLRTPASPSIVAASAGAVLLIGSGLARQNIFRVVRAEPRFYLTIGALEAVNLLTYFFALNIGPTPVVVALHLSAPVLLIVHRVIVHLRPLDFLVCVEVVLIVGAIFLVVSDPVEYSGRWSMLTACALALGSAFAVAMLVTVIAAESANRSAASSAGIQLAIAAMLAAPLILIDGWPTGKSVIALVCAGAALLGPGFYLYWLALRRLDAPTASVLGLGEAVVASALVGAFRAGDVTLTTAAAGVLVVLSVGLESISRRRGVGN